MDKQSKAEKKVLKKLNYFGLYPEEQYEISRMTVDFAFPEDKITIEIDGPHHRTLEQGEKDDIRDEVLQNLGWKVFRFDAEASFDKPSWIAIKIKRIVEKFGKGRKTQISSLEEERGYVEEDDSRSFTQTEDVLLKKYYRDDDLNIKDICKRLKRSEKSVKERLVKLGLCAITGTRRG